MNIIVNGKNNEVTGKTVTRLLNELNINTDGKVIAVNGRFIPWTEYKEFLLKENDKVEITNFVGGG